MKTQIPFLSLAVITALFSLASHAATVTWDASGDSTWEGPSDATSWSGATYLDGDDAQFNDAGAGTVTISNTVNPNSVSVDSTNDYTFTGGDIGGAATLTKGGDGRLFLDSANSYSGATTITGGQIRVSHNDALGAITNGTLIGDNSKLELAGGITIAEPITNQGGGGGKLDSVSGTNTLTGPVQVDSSMDLRGANYIITGGFTSTNDAGVGFNGSNYIVQDTPITLGNGTFGVTSAGTDAANATRINIGSNDWGATTINFGGYLMVGGTDFLPTDTEVRYGWSRWQWSGGTLDLNGSDQTVRALGINGNSLGRGGDHKVTGLAGDVLTINLDAASTFNTYQGRFDGGLSVVKDGDGTLILENLSSTTAPAVVTDPSPGPAIPSTYTGTFTINSGVVESVAGYGAADAVTFADNSKLILAGGTLDLNYTGTDGVGALDLGSGFVADGIWGSTNSPAPNTDPALTGTGTLTVDASLLEVVWDGSDDSTWTSPDPTSWSGETFVDGQDVSFFDTGAGTVTVSGTVSPDSITLDATANYTFTGGEIGGAATLTKNGTGRVFLVSSNTYSGITTIQTGTVEIQDDNALGDPAGHTVINGDGGNNDGLRIGGGITTPETITIGATSGNGSIRGVNLDGTIGGTFTGLITLEDGGTDFRGDGLKFQGGITSAVNQSVSFNGSNYEVAITPIDLNNGTLSVTSAGNLKSNALQVNVGGNDWGLLRINFGGYVLLGGANVLPADADVNFGWSTMGNSTATLDLNGFDQTVASIAQSFNSVSNNGDINITGGGTLTVDLASGTNEYQGRITDGATATALVKTGAGTQILNNLSGTANAYIGGTTVDEGTLSLGDGTTGTDLPDNGGVSVSPTATLELNYTGTDTIGGLDLGAGPVADGVWGSTNSPAPNTDPALAGTGTLTVDGSLLDVVWDGSDDSTWTSPDATSWSGFTYVDGRDAFFFNTGAGTVTVSGAVAPGSVTVNNSAGNDYTFSGGDISSTAALTKSGDGDITLTGVNTFTNETLVENGTFRIDGAGQLGNGSYPGAITINNQATFEYSSTSNQVLTGVISGGGSGGLVKSDVSTLDIPLASTYTGPTTVNGGTLRFTNDADLRSVGTASFLIGSGATLEFQSSVGGANRTVLNNKTFMFDSSGGGTIRFNGGNHLFQGGGSTHTVITLGGSQNAISSTNGGFMNMQGSGIVEFDVADGGDPVDLELSVLFNNGRITKNGDGTLAITTTTSDAGTTNGIVINAGTLEIGGGATLATDGIFEWDIAINNSATFRYNSTANQTLSGVISGTGSLVKDNTGTLTLAGTNTYTGGTTVNAGTLSLGTAASLADGSDVVVATGAILDLNFTGTEFIANLTLGGVPLAPGIYDAATHPAFLTGTGSLTVGLVPGLPRIIDMEIDGSTNVILTLDGPAAGLSALQSDDLGPGSFSAVPSTAGATTLTIDASNVDPDSDGRDFFAVGD